MRVIHIIKKKTIEKFVCYDTWAYSTLYQSLSPHFLLIFLCTLFPTAFSSLFKNLPTTEMKKLFFSNQVNYSRIHVFHRAQYEYINITWKLFFFAAPNETALHLNGKQLRYFRFFFFFSFCFLSLFFLYNFFYRFSFLFQMITFLCFNSFAVCVCGRFWCFLFICVLFFSI